jgi:hypothetical protein
VKSTNKDDINRRRSSSTRRVNKQASKQSSNPVQTTSRSIFSPMHESRQPLERYLYGRIIGRRAREGRKVQLILHDGTNPLPVFAEVWQRLTGGWSASSPAVGRHSWASLCPRDHQGPPRGKSQTSIAVDLAIREWWKCISLDRSTCTTSWPWLMRSYRPQDGGRRVKVHKTVGCGVARLDPVMLERRCCLAIKVASGVVCRIVLSLQASITRYPDCTASWCQE